MIEKKRLAKGVRKYIRQQKARLRREILDVEEQRKQIEELYRKFSLSRGL